MSNLSTITGKKEVTFFNEQALHTMNNTNPETGIRYGVIAMNSLDGDLANDLWHGHGAVDLSYAEAYDEAKLAAERKFDHELEEATIAAAEVDHEMNTAEIERFIDNHMNAVLGEANRDQYVEDALEMFSDTCEIEEPVIEGEYDGVKYRISWLGGAPLLWVFEGPKGYANRLCSPCVPNAADLDGGFTLLDTENDLPNEGDYLCYCVPRDWLAKQ